MTVKEAQEALDDFVGHSVMLPEERKRVMAAADAYALAVLDAAFEGQSLHGEAGKQYEHVRAEIEEKVR